MESKYKIMKAIYSILFLGLILGLTSCEIDNYDKPDAFLTGQITYQDDPIMVGYNEVRFQLWQSGFGNEGPIDVHVDQDGTFSSRMFSGNYRLKLLDGQGPFRANFVNEQLGDTILVDLNGDTNINIEVTPYYMVRNSQFSISGNTVEASASLEQIITDDDAKNIEHVTLYLNSTMFVSSNNDENVARGDADISELSNLSMSVDIPEDITQGYIFARIGVRISGVEDMIFSPVEKLTF
jgi:hypothetical protein